ncbi:hypothetical protein FH972_000555 [Carpinus fangiana]|uniref:D-aminoacyl-tRNA deacylase n=1 Tax=Carpinus fangiana TaxID=176857 RepID=A0A5N6Q964_9ROSI|nr:hypothetical protein FH972_000555 [Carpinus fangiana]
MLALSVFPSLVTTRIKQPTLARTSKAEPIRAMRAVVQRVASASVEVSLSLSLSVYYPTSPAHNNIFPGRGAHRIGNWAGAARPRRTPRVRLRLRCRLHVLNMRLFPNENTGKGWDQNVMQRNYEVLLVSQFTLYGFLKGNKPDFHVAMPPQTAKPFYASLVERFRKSYDPAAIKDGVFGAMMKVNLVNDGPVTMQLDSHAPK